MFAALTLAASLEVSSVLPRHHRRETPVVRCISSLAKVTSPPRFEDYPAGSNSAKQNAPLRLSSKEARNYRTVLRQAASRKPDFAGHYIVASWGCGAMCGDFALIDATSGHVFFDPYMHGIAFPGTADESPVIYRLDSRLLIVEGVPSLSYLHWGNLDAREGIYFFEWTGEKFKLIRFVPRAQACVPDTE